MSLDSVLSNRPDINLGREEVSQLLTEGGKLTQPPHATFSSGLLVWRTGLLLTVVSLSDVWSMANSCPSVSRFEKTLSDPPNFGSGKILWLLPCHLIREMELFAACELVNHGAGVVKSLKNPPGLGQRRPESSSSNWKYPLRPKASPLFPRSQYSAHLSRTLNDRMWLELFVEWRDSVLIRRVPEIADE